MTRSTRGVMVGIAAAVAALLTGVDNAHAAPKRPTYGWIVTESSGGVPTPAGAAPQTNSNSPRTNQRTLLGTPQEDLKHTCRNEHFNQATTREGWMVIRRGRTTARELARRPADEDHHDVTQRHRPRRHVPIYNQIKLSMAITPADPKIIPWSESDMTSAEIRFDSAGSGLASAANGTVFSDFSPTFDLAALARAQNDTAAVQESIQHIDDALHHVERTWPSFIGKAIPGEYKPELGSEQRPLHRMTGEDRIDKNRLRAKKVCVDVWGDGAATPNLNCDEFPFASTYEGAYWSTTEADGDSNGWMQWNGSARMIGEEDNQDAGRDYLNTRFYKANRILDNDKFFVAITS